MTKEPHSIIIQNAQKGDDYAMHQLYLLYGKAMLNTAYRILNNREDAEDALQDAFIKMYARLDQFKYKSTFGAWLKRIVVNQSIDALKKKRAIVFLNDEHLPVREPDSLPSHQENDLQEKLDGFYRSLHQLPDGYRTVLSLYLLEGYDHQEIAQILDIEVSTSISQLSRAKKKLQSLTSKAINNGQS